MDKKLFKTIINQTIFATSTEEARPVLTGINLKITGKKLECTATDSYRLAKKEVTLKSDEYFVLGDNREHSEDGRYFGAIKDYQLVGKSKFKI